VPGVLGDGKGCAVKMRKKGIGKWIEEDMGFLITDKKF